MERDPHQPSIDQLTPEPLLLSATTLRMRAQSNVDFILARYFPLTPESLVRLVNALPSDSDLRQMSEGELILANRDIRRVCTLLKAVLDLMTDVRNTLEQHVLGEGEMASCLASALQPVSSASPGPEHWTLLD